MFGLDSALMLLRKHITLESVFKTLLEANENKHQEKKNEWQTCGVAWQIYVSLATRISSLINLYASAFSSWLAERASLGVYVCVNAVRNIFPFGFLFFSH